MRVHPVTNQVNNLSGHQATFRFPHHSLSLSKTASSLETVAVGEGRHWQHTIDPVRWHPDFITQRNYNFLPTHPPRDRERNLCFHHQKDSEISFHFGFVLRELEEYLGDSLGMKVLPDFSEKRCD
jgi:hypothetical protein